MRLITHNLLCCNHKLCKDKEQALALAIEKFEVKEKEYNHKMVLKMIETCNWALLHQIVVEVGSDI